MGAVEEEDVSGRHRRPIHVLWRRDEVNATTVELGALLIVHSVACGRVYGRVVVPLSNIVEATKITNPFLSVVYKAHERVNVGPTVAASDDRLLAEAGSGYRLARRKLTKWFNANCERDAKILLHCIRVRNSVRSDT